MSTPSLFQKITKETVADDEYLEGAESLPDEDLSETDDSAEREALEREEREEEILRNRMTLSNLVFRGQFPENMPDTLENLNGHMRHAVDLFREQGEGFLAPSSPAGQQLIHDIVERMEADPVAMRSFVESAIEKTLADLTGSTHSYVFSQNNDGEIDLGPAPEPDEFSEASPEHGFSNRAGER